MKRILFLLLLTVSVYGQNPSRFAKIQITGNANSATATKVNVQEANGEVNTQTINTGFNKNIGLGGSDVVGANTLLNQYSTTPVDWTATAFNSGQVVFYGGKQWIAKMATVAGDVPSVSSKWEEITFDALANKTVTVDQTIIDGSTNAVSGNAVFDALATKAPLASPSLTGTPTSPTATAGTNTTQVATTAFVTNGIATADSQNVKLTGNQTISGQKSFSLTGKIDMQTNNGFPAISVTALGSNGQSAAEFINNSSSPYSTALRLRTSSSGGVGNMALNVSNQSSIGTGIFSDASNGGVSISSQSGNGDSYISNITYGGTGRNYVGRNNGTETYSVDKIGNVIGNSYIKRSAPTTNLLLAGGGDIAQGTFALASSVHNPVTLGTANGLSLSTQQLSLGLASSGVTGALSGTDWNTFNNKENAFSKNTAFNKPFGITAGTVVEGGTLGSNAYSSTAYLPLSGGTLTGILNIDDVDSPKIFFRQNSSLISLVTNNFGIYGTGSKTDFNTFVYGNNPYGIWTNGVRRVTVGGDGDTTFSGTISASPATTANQVPTLGQVQAVARPYKVYTALLSQTGTNAPTATVLENTLGGTVVWSRTGVGIYNATLSGAFTTNKTIIFISGPAYNWYETISWLNTSILNSNTRKAGVLSDDVFSNTSVEIRVYN